jgi:hypothetical protein
LRKGGRDDIWKINKYIGVVRVLMQSQRGKCDNRLNIKLVSLHIKNKKWKIQKNKRMKLSENRNTM